MRGYTATAPDGRTVEFKLDIPKIIEREEKDPSYSFIKEMESMDGNPRFTTLYAICEYIGTTYDEFVEMGFTVQDLAEIMGKCLESAGFRSAPMVPPSSSEALQ